MPLGINVESLSIFKEEIDAAHTLFQKLQVRRGVWRCYEPCVVCCVLCAVYVCYVLCVVCCVHHHHYHHHLLLLLLL